MSKRDPFFDSLKFVLICLVVFGHILECSINDKISFKVYTFIYTFHMPLFIFISGYFSKNTTWPKLKNAFKTLIPAYFVFQLILSIPNIIDGSFRIFNFLTSPQSILWYIPALLYWRIAFYFIAKVRLPFWVIFSGSVVLSLLIGFINYPVFMSVTKSITFFPYFVLGYYCTENVIQKIRGWYKIFSTVILVIIFACIYLFATSDFTLNLYGDFGYKYMFNSIPVGLVCRAGSLILVIIASCAVINITTSRLSKWGDRTLDIYLLHAPLVYIGYAFIINRFNLSPDLLIALAAFAVIMPLCILLMKIKLFQYLVNPVSLFERKK